MHPGEDLKAGTMKTSVSRNVVSFYDVFSVSDYVQSKIGLLKNWKGFR